MVQRTHMNRKMKNNIFAPNSKIQNFSNDVNGANIQGVHYIVPRTEPELIFGKKDRCGFFAVKTKKGTPITHSLVTVGVL